MDDVNANDLIVEYCGEVIDDTELHRRLEEYRKQSAVNYYMFRIGKNLVLDASVKGNNARFINHSCQPNCYSQKWWVGSTQRVGIFALVDIPAGKELTYNYNFDGIGTQGIRQACFCGAPNCSGHFGAKPKKDWEVEEENERKQNEKRKNKRKKKSESDTNKRKSKKRESQNSKQKQRRDRKEKRKKERKKEPKKNKHQKKEQ